MRRNPVARRRTDRRRRLLLAVVASWLVALSGAAAEASVPLLEGEDVTLDLAGYLRSLSGLQQLTYDTGGLLPETIGLNASVLRLELRMNLGEHVTLDVHDRLFWQLTSAPQVLGAAMGVGVSTPPQRNVDLAVDLVDQERHLLSNDVDRASVRLFFDVADLTLGRQAITWGTSNLFTVADLWSSFSPFELDLSEKRGIDAARAITTLGDSLELDLVVADRGPVEDLSGGARLTAYLAWADVYGAVAKHWDQLMAFAGVSAEVDVWKLRGEASWTAYSLDREEVDAPRVTAGADYFGDGWFGGVELHYSGVGAAPDADYLATAASARVGRGELYLWGRFYAGAVASWEATELLTMSLTTLGNLQDPSLLLAPGMSYRLSDEAEVAMGAYVTFGEAPSLLPSPSLPSEFGAYGNLYYAQLAGYL